MVIAVDDTAMRFLVALIAGPIFGWTLGYFIRKSIKVMAFIGGLFFFIIGVMYYSKSISNLSVLQKGVEDTIETAVNRTVEYLIKLLLIQSIPLFVSGLVVGLGFGLNNGRHRMSRLVIEE